MDQEVSGKHAELCWSSVDRVWKLVSGMHDVDQGAHASRVVVLGLHQLQALFGMR